MKENISAKIDVTKIDRNQLFQGKKGTYLSINLIPTPGSQFGIDYMVTQSATDKENWHTEPMILGNAKVIRPSKTDEEAAMKVLTDANNELRQTNKELMREIDELKSELDLKINH